MHGQQQHIKCCDCLHNHFWHHFLSTACNHGIIYGT